jgi:putative acetyltransferase
MRVRPGAAADLPRALEIWRAAVDATHGFLTPADRAEIDAMVEHQFLPNVNLSVAEDDAGTVVGFLVMDGEMIDALFVDPTVHGQGAGTLLLEHALEQAPNPRVDASEQASNALPFYLARGFKVIGRSEQDPQGRPYPLIHLRYDPHV